MSVPTTPAALMIKAARAVESAQLLLDDGDLDGACNRAYYAMFDAARAALLAAQAPVSADISKTHGGLIAAFGLHLVKTGRVPLECGRSLNRGEEIRLVADYRGESVDSQAAAEMIERARVFIKTIAELPA